VAVADAWYEHNTHHNQVESISFRFEMNNGLGATGVWLKETSTGARAPLTIVLDDRGKQAADKPQNHTQVVADRMERGEQVLAADLLFTGDDAPDAFAFTDEEVHDDSTNALFDEMLAASGVRPLGMEAAQLIALAEWAKSTWNPSSIRVETRGIRSQMISLVAAGLKPSLFSEIENDGGMNSLAYLLEKPVLYAEAPDLFCLDLYKDFDVGQLEALASPSRVFSQNPVVSPSAGR